MKNFYDKNEIEVGIDESSIGCAIGPLFIGAVIFPKDSELYLKDKKMWNLIKDSKKLSKKKRFLVNIPFSFAKFQSYFLQMMPNPLLTPDQVELLKHNNIVSGDHPTLKDLGITGTPIQNILPKYIYRFRTGGQFG